MENSMPEACKLVLKNIYGSDMGKYNINVHGTGKKGEGYVNDMVFLTLSDSTEELHLVIKMMPVSKTASTMTESLRLLYAIEIDFYENIWPILENFQRKYLTTNRFDKIAKYYGCLKDEKYMVLVLDNLKVAGFVLRDKHHLYDKKLVKYLFEQFAKFHAISFALKDKEPEVFDKLKDSVKKSWNSFKDSPLMKISLPKLFNIVTSFLPEKGYAREKMEDFTSRILEEFNNVTNYTGNNHILTHGDSWINNFLFKVDKSGELLDVRFLDFQLVELGPPVYDLSYLFYSGATKEILEELEHYLKIYHSTLSKRLREFGCDPEKIYTYEKFKEEWKQYSKFGFIMSILTWRGKTADNPVDITDVNQLKNSTSEDRKCDDAMYARMTGDIIYHVIEKGFI